MPARMKDTQLAAVIHWNDASALITVNELSKHYILLELYIYEEMNNEVTSNGYILIYITEPKRLIYCNVDIVSIFGNLSVPTLYLFFIYSK